jgi:hypothetical protein
MREVNMRILIAKISLSCGPLLLGGIGYFAYASSPANYLPSADRPAIEQAGQTEGNTKIIVIYRGSTKDPAASVSLDGNEKGKLPSRMYLAMPSSDGSHTIAVGGFEQRKVMCKQVIGVWGEAGSDNIVNIEMPFHPASLTVTLAERETTYLLIERNRPSLSLCSSLSSSPSGLTNYRLREIKAKDGEKLVKKFEAMQ